jgi:hypothetical protein
MKKYSNLLLATAIFYFTTFSYLVVAQKSQSNAGPKLYSAKEIEAEVKMNDENRAVITWVMPEEGKSARFIVQRSRDNETFFDIREVEVGENPTQERLQFTFTDYKMLKATEYYRIMEYERNGNSRTYASIVAKPNLNSLVWYIRNTENGTVRVTVDNSKNLTALLGTESGLGVPCEFEMENDKVVLLRPLYPLTGGNYLIKLRSVSGETQMKLTVKGQEEL